MQSKGINYLLDAIPAIVEKYTNVYFLIVGYPVEQSKKRVEDLKVIDFVTFPGKTEYFQLPEYLALADVAVDPKVDEAGEGSGKIMNYMGACLPVVCFDSINNRSFLGVQGLYAKPGDSEDLAHKIIEILENDELARTLGENNRKKVNDHFSWSSNGQKLSEIYNKLTH